MIELNEEQKIILENVKKVAKERIAPLASEIDRVGVFRWDIARLFGKMGLFQIFLPPSYGGLEEHKTLMFCLCVEEIAKAYASSALILVIQAVGSFPIIVAGNQSQRDDKGKGIARFFCIENFGNHDEAYHGYFSLREIGNKNKIRAYPLINECGLVVFE